MADSPRRASDQLLEMVPDIMYEYRFVPVPGFVYVSPSVTAIVGYTPEEHYADPLLGRRIVHPEDLPRLDTLATELDERRLHLIRWRHRNGDEVLTAHRIRGVHDEAGTLTGLLGVCRPAAQSEPAWRVRFGRLSLDLASHRATVGGRSLALTSSEQQILAQLAGADRIVSRREIVERLWGEYHASGERAVEVHISNLRRKLVANAGTTLRLQTVRGAGYRLAGLGEEPEDAGLKMS
jgi:DNA-binding winged helix-turn-helix (wHTH) protein